MGHGAFASFEGPNLSARRTDDKMRKFVTGLMKDEAGVTAMEYGLIASLIASAVIAVLWPVGINLATTFDTIADNLATALK